MDTPHSTRRFYVYVLARPNGQAFYVGKGSGRRFLDHEGEARSGHMCYRCKVIRQIWRRGGVVERSIVFETDDEHEAYAHECEVIAHYGRENLCNHTDGGNGTMSRSTTGTEIRPHVAATVATYKERRKRRKNGHGCIHRRKDGRWCASVTEETSSARQHRKYFYGNTRREVLVKLNAYLTSTDEE